MEEDKIKEVYEQYKIKNFDSKNPINGTQKSLIVRRVNNRLENMLKKSIKEDKELTDFEIKKYIDKQIEKLDKTKKETKLKRSSSDLFKTEWGEEIYRKNAFLGAELNKLTEYSKVNKKIIRYIHNKEKINKKPSEKEVNQAIERFLSEMDKEGFDDSTILRRKSVKHILEAFLNHSESYSIPYSDEEIESGAVVYLKIEANSLSYAEVRILKNIFEHEMDESSNMIMIVAGLVDSPVGTQKVELAEAMILKEVTEIFLEDVEKYVDYEQDSVSEIIKEMDERTKKQVDSVDLVDKDEKELQRKLLWKKRFFNIGIFICIVSIVAIVLYRLNIF